MIGSALPFLTELCPVLKYVKYVLIVNLACCDVVTDFLNGISFLFTENWQAGVLTLFFVWFPAPWHVLTVKSSEGFCKRCLTLICFPFQMIFNGILSLASRCDQAKSKKAEQDFLDMKRFELLLEALPQLILNMALRMLEINNGWIAVLSGNFSMLSVISGVIGLTGSLAEDQKNIKNIRLLGRLMVILILVLVLGRLPFAAAFFHPEFPLEFKAAVAVVSCYSLVLNVEENLYLFFYQSGLGQRITRHDQTNSLGLKIKFWILQPTFVSLRHSWLYYVIFLITKLLPNFAITGFLAFSFLAGQLNGGSVTDAIGWFDVVCLSLLIVLPVVLSILHCIYLFKPEWFFTEASQSDAEDLGDIKLGCGAEDEPDSIESARERSDGDLEDIELGSRAEDEPDGVESARELFGNDEHDVGRSRRNSGQK